MAETHTVGWGECMASLSAKNGLSNSRTIYDHPRNAALKQKRPNPNMLSTGDVVFVPDKQSREESRPTDQQHKFVRVREPVHLRLQVLSPYRNPLPNLRYELLVAGKTSQGVLNSQGELDVEVDPLAEIGFLTLWTEGQGAATPGLTIRLYLGYLPPIEEIKGVQVRLTNLGYYAGYVDGTLNPQTREALKQFQARFSLDPSGQLDDPTRARLREIHDGA